jgi:hypothetical protein
VLMDKYRSYQAKVLGRRYAYNFSSVLSFFNEGGPFIKRAFPSIKERKITPLMLHRGPTRYGGGKNFYFERVRSRSTNGPPSELLTHDFVHFV